MKIAYINIGKAGSTGRIIIDLSRIAEEKQIETLSVYPGGRANLPKSPNDYIVAPEVIKLLTREMTYISGLEGRLSIISTFLLIMKLQRFDPDIIHLNNLHGWYLNIPMLFSYIKKNNIRVIWTFHDCWPITGHCTHFQINNCKKWCKECNQCELHLEYPKCYFDNSKSTFRMKRKAFTGIDNLTIVTPSEWLEHIVSQSFLRDYKILTINNGIDLSKFKPTKSNFRECHACQDKHIVLGVQSSWGYKKGIDVFIKLSEILPDKYLIVLVGTTSKIDADLPNNILSIHRTNNVQELAEIYSAADVFVNPTREDTFPTVNIEALACGTPVVTFDVCGSGEIIDETCGIKIPKDDINELYKAITMVCEDRCFDSKACIRRSKKFDKEVMFQRYFDLYMK